MRARFELWVTDQYGREYLSDWSDTRADIELSASIQRSIGGSARIKEGPPTTGAELARPMSDFLDLIDSL
jgi:hypothetical protein